MLGERALAPDLAGEGQQGVLLGRELDVLRQLVALLRDAVALLLRVVLGAGGRDGLERHAEVAQVVLVALELALEVVAIGGHGVALGVAVHGREQLVLGEALRGGDEREHEVELSPLDGHAGAHGAGRAGGTGRSGRVGGAAGGHRGRYSSMPRTSTTKTIVEPAGTVAGAWPSG